MRVTSANRRTAVRSGIAAAAAALLINAAAPSRLIGEDDQIHAMQQHRVARLQSWLSAQNGAMEAAEALAQSVIRESERHALDPVLVLAVIHVESRFDRNAISPRGAQGLMQVRTTAVQELIGEGRLPARRHDLRNPQVNVEVGVSYLAHLVAMFGDLNTALAAYNWGPTRIREKIAANEGIPSAYVSKVLRTQRLLELELARVEVERSAAEAAA